MRPIAKAGVVGGVSDQVADRAAFRGCDPVPFRDRCPTNTLPLVRRQDRDWPEAHGLHVRVHETNRPG